MSTQILLDKLAADRDEQVAVIKAESAEKVAAIKVAMDKEVAALAEVAAAVSAKEVAQINRAALSKARQAGKLLVQTAKREAFDAVMTAAEKTVVAADPAAASLFADRRADLEVVLAKQLA